MKFRRNCFILLIKQDEKLLILVKFLNVLLPQCRGKLSFIQLRQMKCMRHKLKQCRITSYNVCYTKLLRILR